MLDRRRERAGLEGYLGLDAVCHERVVAELRKRERRETALAARAGGAVGVVRGLGLEVGREGVAHA